MQSSALYPTVSEASHIAQQHQQLSRTEFCVRAVRSGGSLVEAVSASYSVRGRGRGHVLEKHRSTPGGLWAVLGWQGLRGGGQRGPRPDPSHTPRWSPGHAQGALRACCGCRQCSTCCMAVIPKGLRPPRCCQQAWPATAPSLCNTMPMRIAYKAGWFAATWTGSPHQLAQPCCMSPHLLCSQPRLSTKLGRTRT